MNYRADVHHDPLGPATDIKPWPITLTTEDRMPSKKPRTITKTMQQLKQVRYHLREAVVLILDAEAALRDSDARETRPDPSKRRRAKAK